MRLEVLVVRAPELPLVAGVVAALLPRFLGVAGTEPFLVAQA